MQKKIVLFTVFLLLCNFIGAQEIRKYSNEFLNIGVSARALGMSNATAANVDNVSAGYWNPAGLLKNKYRYDAALMHNEHFAGIVKYDYAAFSYKVDSSLALAFSAIRSGIDNIQDTRGLLFDSEGNLLNYDEISYFSVADYAFIFSMAKSTAIPNLTYGINFKFIYRNQGDFASALGFGLDAGMQYQKGKWKFGAMASDISTTFSVWNFNEQALEVAIDNDSIQNTIPENSTEVKLPSLTLGIARDFGLPNKINLLVEADFDFTFDGKRHVLIEGNPVSIAPYAGIELDYNKLFYFRFGVGNMQKIVDFDKESMFFQPNLGLGVKIANFSIDYALTDIGGSMVSYSNLFSLRYSFNRFNKN